MNTRQIKKINVLNEVVQSPTCLQAKTKEHDDDLKRYFNDRLKEVENNIMSTISSLTAEIANVRSEMSDVRSTVKSALARVEAFEKSNVS